MDDWGDLDNKNSASIAKNSSSLIPNSGLKKSSREEPEDDMFDKLLGDMEAKKGIDTAPKVEEPRGRPKTAIDNSFGLNARHDTFGADLDDLPEDGQGGLDSGTNSHREAALAAKKKALFGAGSNVPGGAQP